MDLRKELEAALGQAYSLEGEIRGGGMSRVFVAEERALHRKVVIKVLPPELAALVSIRRFNREMMLAAQLQHPHVVPVLASGEVRGLPWYTMPYVEGESLRAALERTPALPVSEAVSILRDVARALGYAHERGIVHRDIKPGNVLLSGGSAVVTDFGVAKALARQTEGVDPDFTPDGASVGTPTYMAPEQVAGRADVDHRADIYAFGVLAFELLTGRSPSHGLTLQTVLAAHVDTTPDPAELARPTIPPPLANLVMRCLARDPGDRPQSAAELLSAFEAMGTPARGGPRVATAARPWWRSGAVQATGVMIVVIGIATYVWANRNAARSAIPDQSVAVLPFENAGGDTTNAYFADGLADELITALGKIPTLRVAARSSSFSFRGKHVAVTDVGRQLRVAAVLEASVRREGSTMRISAQLSNARDGMVLWSEKYEKEVTDVFAVQDDITRQIVGALRVRLAEGAAAPAAAVGTSDFDAHDLFLRGRYRLAADDQRKAIDYFRRAIARDSGYARAWSGLADAYYLLAAHAYATPAEALPHAKEAAQRAIALDSTLADAHVSLGNVARWWDYDRALAEREFRHALQLDPRYPEAHLSYGWFLVDRGDTARALSEARQAVALDPLSPRMRSDLGTLLLLSGRRDSAMAEFRRMVEFDPANRTAALLLGRALLASGRVTEGTLELHRTGLDELRVDLELARWSNPPGPPAAAAKLALVADRASRTRYVAAEWVAMLYVRAGQPEQALSTLERGLREHALSPELGMMAEFTALRADPRFQAILAGMGVGTR